ncbi:unnamed protein product, partial [Laminaria digitata]
MDKGDASSRPSRPPAVGDVVRLTAKGRPAPPPAPVSLARAEGVVAATGVTPAPPTNSTCERPAAAAAAPVTCEAHPVEVSSSRDFVHDVIDVAAGEGGTAARTLREMVSEPKSSPGPSTTATVSSEKAPRQNGRSRGETPPEVY